MASQKTLITLVGGAALGFASYGLFEMFGRNKSRSSRKVTVDKKGAIKIVVLGANGFVGWRLAKRLIETKTYASPGSDKEYEIAELVLMDIVISSRVRDYVKGYPIVKLVEGDICDVNLMADILHPNGAEKITCFHIAAIMSGPSERNFDLGRRVNLLSPMNNMEILRNYGKELGSPQTYVFTSTDYVCCCNDYNKKNPTHEESFRLSPVSYGVQKACVELLVSDYSRKGFIDGRALRLSCVVVKPGVFDVLSYPYHGIISQTLGSKDKVFSCPLKPEQRFACSFIRNTVDCLYALGKSVSGSDIGHNRTIQVPARSFALQELWESVQKVGAELKVDVGEVKWVKSEESQQTVKEVNVPPAVSHEKARNLGLPVDFTIDDVIRDYMRNEMNLLEV